MLEKKFISTIRKYSLINPKENVLVALSGGPDSVTLLYLLLKLKDKLKVNVFAAHLNHMLRGEESDRDEEFVRKLCNEWNVTLFVERRNVKEISKGKNVEAIARKERYDFLRKTLKEIGGGKIATGHTASDLVETVLLNLTKGTGIRGLRGFLPKSGNVIRPLIEITRKEIEEYTKKEKLPYVIDSSNYDKSFERNLIRLDVIPVLKKINPSLESAFLKTCETLRLLEDFLNKEVETVIHAWTEKDEIKIPLQTFKSLHPFLRREAVQKAFEQISGRKLSFKNLLDIEKLADAEGYKEIHLGSGFKAVKEDNTIKIRKEQEKPKSFSFKVTKIPTTLHTPLYTLHFAENEGEPLLPITQFKEKGITVRNRKPGDKVNLGKFHKPLKKLLMEKKIPPTLRWQIPIITSGEEIIYIPDVFKAYIKGKPFVGVKVEKRETEKTDS
ncbi:tRNA(Ile)-lysidine synthase [Desulfurobacterium pacificum]|uniref:tRNA(Ile)-lysidine synthase n=1 Tax=Desulfurobacterium pacificum TaxID=240166 RepID=A0ABY1NKJ2_9BACT|nr:tRNA lysidine(34) synthetase TilS [Desulfurobacterium pacificum]SMP11186.1 tRNA(Ile)-lysidine synthase [Desulfurobacterium pacificum]